MKLNHLRLTIQFASFAVLTYGGRFGLKLGHSLPCFACPYVGGCSGHCYLMALQGSQWGFQIPFTEAISVWGLRALGTFSLFLLLTIIFYKTWCGWICPFGAVQDWITCLRKKVGIRESLFSWRLRKNLKPIKYILLALLIVIPMLIANTGLHSDFKLPFCQICPAKPLMPIFEGNFRYFSIDTTNIITIIMTTLSVTLTAGLLVGMVFKDRFFCMVCPLLGLISLFDKISLFKLKKTPDACTGCGTCQRLCPMDIKEVHFEKERENVLTQDCLLCLKCVESCPQDEALSLTYLKRKLFSSSKANIAKSLK